MTEINSEPSYVKDKSTKPFLLAIEEYRRICQKTRSTPNSNFVNSLKQDPLIINTNLFSIKEVPNVGKIIDFSRYFKHIVLNGISNQEKANGMNKSKAVVKKPNNTANAPISFKDKIAINKHIINGLAKNLALSKVQCLETKNFKFSFETASSLAEGIVHNDKSLITLSFQNCQFFTDNSNEDLLEIVLKGLLSHETLEILDLPYNNLADKNINIIKRIIDRQTERRDQVKWAFNLRNEMPDNNLYKRGLISINLNNNNLTDISAEIIANALLSDSYIVSIDLSNNYISEVGCKNFVKILRTNTSLINVDLSENPGYTEEIHMRLIVKLARNLKELKTTMDNFDYFAKFVNPDLYNVSIPEDGKYFL